MSRQQEILDYIIQHQKQKGYSPTFREIGAAVGLKSSSTVSGHLDRLENKRMIKRIAGSARAIEVITQTHGAKPADMRRRVVVHVLEVSDNGTFKTIIIGGNRYVLDQ
ncbi:LexA family protein [Paenibacillus dokdonensis]|uniref:LexA family protein n=1 Tax=Paenibacillus dokdonensis TaxID=2567944 RepID=UPI002DB604BC|nr:hypothetical protein [Paenibacillus dokdonensis]